MADEKQKPDPQIPVRKNWEKERPWDERNWKDRETYRDYAPRDFGRD